MERNNLVRCVIKTNVNRYNHAPSNCTRKNGTPIQFGASPNTGCSDGIFSHRSMIQMNEEHDINSWIVFVDLMKAFDSIHHKLMFELLKKTIIPDRPLKVIKKLYKDFKIQINVGICNNLIDCPNGVKQGNNFALILFIIVMQFLAELFEKNDVKTK